MKCTFSVEQGHFFVDREADAFTLFLRANTTFSTSTDTCSFKVGVRRDGKYVSSVRNKCVAIHGQVQDIYYYKHCFHSGSPMC